MLKPVISVTLAFPLCVRLSALIDPIFSSKVSLGLSNYDKLFPFPSLQKTSSLLGSLISPNIEELTET